MDIDHFSISASQVTPEILALFDFTRPTMPRAFNVLEGVNRGQILVDDLTHPEWAVVRDGTYGTLYLGGRVNAGLLSAVVLQFREIGEVGIGCWLDDPLNELIPPQPDYDGRTLYFVERLAVDSAAYSPLPDNLHLARRDAQLIRKSFDYESALASFGTVEAILQRTLGVFILDGDTVVCEAATGAPTHGVIEVGITTAEPYRRQGFATLACAKLIEMCEAEGYSTWWDCAKQNVASANLARKLGYRNEREYRYVWWASKAAGR